MDTSVLVGALVEKHPRHETCFACLSNAARGDVKCVVAAHSLAETYAVLTTLPVRPRISPANARRLIRHDIQPYASVVALTAKEYADALTEMAALGVAGGTVYDGLICRAAAKSDVDRLLTLNARDLQRCWPEGANRISEP